MRGNTGQTGRANSRFDALVVEHPLDGHARLLGHHQDAVLLRQVVLQKLGVRFQPRQPLRRRLQLLRPLDLRSGTGDRRPQSARAVVRSACFSFPLLPVSSTFYYIR
eukprot:1379602-Pyramimonas_sp.AAC.1